MGKPRNIFERAAVLTQTPPVPFFQQEPKRQRPKISGLISPPFISNVLNMPRIMSFDELKLLSVTQQLKTVIKLTTSQNEKISLLQNQIATLKETRKTAQKTATSASEIYRSAAKSGRPLTYYAAESVSLCSDLEYTIAVHNIELFSSEIEKLKKEITKKTLERSNAFASLSLRERERVLQMLGTKSISPNFETEQVNLPTTAARKYSIHIRLRAPEGDEDDIDPEVFEHFEEEQIRWEANGDGKRGNSGWKAQMVVAGMAQAGIKAAKIYASAGSKRNEAEEFELDEVVRA